MMQNEIKKNIHRILVSLDFDDYNSPLVESLVRLASHLDAELCGLFIEDSALQQVANLPFSREITHLTALTRELNSKQIARHLKQHAETLQNMMLELSRLSNVACSFKSAKGPRIESILGESNDFQLVVLLPEKYSSVRNKPSAKLDELINPTVMLYDDSEQAQKSGYVVRSLADRGELHQLRILTLSPDDEAQAKEQFNFENVKTDYQHLNSYKIKNIISLLEAQNTGLLILPLDDALIKHSTEIIKIHDDLE